MDDTREIAVIPGDGIGQEVVPIAVSLVRQAAGDGVQLAFTEYPWGCDYYLASGRMMPDDGLAELDRFDAIFLGAVGDPARVPDHVSLWGLLLRIRRGLHLSINVRPARSLEGVPSPLRDPAGFDLVVVRENSEGEYSQVGGAIHDGPDEVVLQTSVFTRRATESVIRYAFELARTRRRHLTSATKSNGIADTMPFWDRVVREVAADYADVQVRSMHVDALAARLVAAPQSLDVIVASNLFGDILTDLTGTLMGSLGVAPSVNRDPTGAHPPLFEPVHGSAPDIAGSGIADPAAQIWCGALMLEHLGLPGAATRLLAALEATMAAGDVTPDLGGTLSTVQMGEAVGRRLVASAAATA